MILTFFGVSHETGSSSDFYPYEWGGREGEFPVAAGNDGQFSRWGLSLQPAGTFPDGLADIIEPVLIHFP